MGSPMFASKVSSPKLLEWLTRLDFILLDSSLCNQRIRSYFLDLVRSYCNKFQKFLFPENTCLPLTSTINLWCTRRNFNNIWSNTIVEIVNDPGLESNDSRLAAMNISKIKIWIDKPTSLNILKQLSDLRHLKLLHTNLTTTVPSEIHRVIAQIGQLCPHLTAFDCSRVTHMHEVDVMGVVRTCHNLTELRMGGVQFLCRSIMSYLIVYGRNLKHLDIRDCNIVKRNLWKLLLHRKKNLIEFQCNLLDSLTTRSLFEFNDDDAMLTFCHSSVLLRTVKRLDFDNFCVSQLVLTSLTSLSLIKTGVSPAGLISTLKYLSDLRILKVVFNETVTDEHIDKLSQVLSPELKEFWFVIDNKAVVTTLVNLQLITLKCPDLVTLCLQGFKVNDLHLVQTLQNCSSALSALHLSLNVRISDPYLLQIGQLCPQLTTLDLSFGVGLTHTAVVEAVTICSRLTSLSLGGMFSLAEVTKLSPILTACPTLTYLDLMSSDINDKGIACLIKKVPKLRYLSLMNCEKINPPLLLECAKKLKKLREIQTHVDLSQSQCDALHKANPLLIVNKTFKLSQCDKFYGV